MASDFKLWFRAILIHCGVSHRTKRMAIISCQLALTGAVSCGILSTTSPSGQSNCIISYVCPNMSLFRIFEKALQCCDIHPVEHVAIIGTTTGEWHAIELGASNHTLNVNSFERLSLETGSVTSKGADGRGEAIALVKYSPDGKFLAVGSHDNNVYLYQ